MTAAYHLQLFGIPRLLDPGGAHVRLRTRKQLGLLVYLALEARNRPVGRDVLLELFWPDAAEGLARHSLSQALTAIRRELGAGAVTRAGELVRLLGPLTTDLDPAAPRGLEFGDLANPLDGVDSWAGASLAHWVDGVRTRCLKDMRVRLLNDLMAARSSGQVKAVRERATLLYEVDPLNDRAALSLAEDYLLEQDTAGAIGLLRAHVDRSLEESGHAPTPEIVQLLARLERGLVPEPESPQAMARPEVFVGRKEELSRLEAVWTRVQGTKLCTLIISGPTGIGKSALIRRFCSSVAARARPAYVVGCQEMGRNIPFAAVSDLIHRLARDPALSGTDPLWLAEASRVSPRLRGIYPGIPEPPPAPAEAVRIRVADAMHMMLEAVADGGAMIVAFDNVQHMDPASRDVLHLLLRRLEDVPVLVVGTRLCDANDSFVPTAHSVEDGIEWQEGFYLGPLDDIATNALLEKLSQGVADAADAMAEITKLAQGVPYLIEMLYSEWERNPTQSLVATQLGGDGSMTGWRPPDTMRLAFARQYLGLSTDALHILHLLAVAERVLPSTEIAELLSASQSIVDRAALELIDRALVRVEAGAIGFKNEFHRAFVY
ncbi:MAG: AAA family ATPase, partial [Gemmatimonadales bacterium]